MLSDDVPPEHGDGPGFPHGRQDLFEEIHVEPPFSQPLRQPLILSFSKIKYFIRADVEIF